MMRLLQIPQGSVRHLHGFEASATNLRKIISAQASRLDDRSVDLTIAMLDNEIDLMRRIPAIDEQGALATLDLPVRELTEIAKLRVDCDRIQRVLDTSPMRYAVEQFAGSVNGVEQALSALDWLHATKAIYRAAVTCFADCVR